jgi:serine/threonine protein kinase/Tol biopolymer transport system component
MTLAPGDRFGSYEVVELVGAGGMGEVYRCRDSRLGRDVALKVLPDTRRLVPEAVQRFDREAQLLASLNHPNIATLHGLEESDGAQALVMELVDGETLDARLARSPRAGAVPLAEVLQIARQVADALDAAHERGVVHRDLKPANIKVRADGTVKVLDFGIAKMLGGDASVHGGAALTVTQAPDAILGTPSYMSPEQASGRAVDRRTDIWAFGCVLYEMLAGRRAFEAETTSGTLARVIEREPDWSALPANLPPAVRRTVRLCLEKDLRKRRQAAGDVRIDLEEATTQQAADEPVRASSRRARVAWVGAALIVIGALAIPAAVHLNERPPPEMRLQVVTPQTHQPLDFALSPDGRHIVVAGLDEAGAAEQLYLRALDSDEARPLAGTAGARLPFWSPDSRSVGYFAAGNLYAVDISGGAPQLVAAAQIAMGGAWSSDGTILFAPNTVSALLRVPASGGEPVAVTELDRPRQMGHRLPSFLPDGRRFLYYVFGEPQVAGIYLGSLEGGESKRLTPAATAGTFVAPHYVVLGQQGALVARRLDLTRGELVGDPIVVASNAGADAGSFAAAFSASAAGILAHRSGTSPPAGTLRWFDRAGSASQPIGDFVPNGAELSPDERQIAMDRVVDGNRDVWLFDLGRGALTRFTSDLAVDGYPLWSPDGSRIVFESTRRGTFDLWIKPANSAESETLLLETPDTEYPLAWSNDGQFLLFQRTNLNETWDLWALPMTREDRTPIAVATTPFIERMGQLSPDGRWVAYETNESGRAEIVMQSFPTPAGRWQVSTEGGVAPRWSADGRELYFVATDGRMMAASVAGADTSLEVGTPVALFAAQLTGQVFKHQYSVARDGRFLLRALPAEQAPAPPITLILNWQP